MTLTQILQKIKSVFYTKTEIDSMGGGTNLSTTISNKANDSDVVHKSGDTMAGSLDFYATTDTYLAGLQYYYNGTRYGYILGHVANNGTFKSILCRADYVLLGDNIIPLGNVGALGTSTNKWKTINGVSPSALSLPNYENGFSIIGNFNPTSTTNKGSWTATCDCMIFISGGDIEGSFSVGRNFHWFRRGINALWGVTSLCIFANKGDVVTLQHFGSSQGYNVGSFDIVNVYPCQGNV